VRCTARTSWQPRFEAEIDDYHAIMRRRSPIASREGIRRVVTRAGAGAVVSPGEHLDGDDLREERYQGTGQPSANRRAGHSQKGELLEL